ncbi:cystin-1 [Ochotona curzoniae]|uniref:cystin-1 n=1 Tax=Ochotona curzoniae TaxID=130825 RepID=UPI001B34C70C|nr:cystin-1 [Ochotona curzoniae]
MGSGSSRSGRGPRRRRSPDSGRPAEGAAAEGGAGPRVPGARAEADAVAAQDAACPDPARGPAAPPDGRDETLRLLDQLLAESEAWGPAEPRPGPEPPSRPAAGAGSAAPPEGSADNRVESSSAPEGGGSSCTRPEEQSAVSYDPSEEELMASIEREFCPGAHADQAAGYPAV